MAKNNKIQLFRTETSGSTTTDILKGELAMNINSNSPFIMFKDTSGTVQKLGSLSSSTGSSIYHTMTQKAITDALTTRKSETDTLLSSLNSEIKARKAVDGQSGQTYSANTGATYISGATSLNDADIKLNNAITAEISNRATAITNAINALDVTDTAVSGQYVSSVSEIDGKISVSRTALPSSTVTGDGTHVDITIIQSAGKISSVNISENDIASANALSIETTNRTNTDNRIITAVGLNSDGTFKVPTTAQTSGYTSAATSVMDAIIILDNQVEENETVTAYALTDLNDRLNALNDWCSYMSGHTTTSSLTSIPTTKRLCIATISSSQTLGLNGTIDDGREVHVMVYNTSSNEITITIPTTFVNMNGEDLIISANSHGEINILYDGTKLYYRAAPQIIIEE